MNTKEKINALQDKLKIINKYANAIHVLNYDLETVCPSKARENQGETIAFLSNETFKIKDSKEFKDLVVDLYKCKDELEELDRVLVENLYDNYLKTKNITPELDLEMSLIFNKAFVVWLKAKETSDYNLFLPELKKVLDIEKKVISLMENRKEPLYDNLLDKYEKGMTSEKLDDFFTKLRDGLVPIVKEIANSKHHIRNDFMTRKVDIKKQEEFSKYLLKINGFDFERGSLGEAEHPFTDDLAVDDVRVTTHYYEDMFISNVYSVIHEGGHAFFGQNEPREYFDHNVGGSMTLGMHESVSRFYENVVGRSRSYIHLIYPKFKELFSEEFSDVSEEELYEAVNEVTPSLIRTEADEVTYSLHIIIRYELEKDIVSGKLDLADLPSAWNKKYKEYLGIDVLNDKLGVLQDVHWTGGFGYFPTYALGNGYNAMYYNRMRKEINVDELIASGNLAEVNEWMIENVFKKASILKPNEWIKDITNEELDPTYFINYIKDKYSKIYRF